MRNPFTGSVRVFIGPQITLAKRSLKPRTSLAKPLAGRGRLRVCSVSFNHICFRGAQFDSVVRAKNRHNQGQELKLSFSLLEQTDTEFCFAMRRRFNDLESIKLGHFSRK